MAKTAAWAVPDGEQKAPEGRKNRELNNPDQAETCTSTHSIRGAFARSICRANDFGTSRDQAACDDGVPCSRLSQCLGQADITLRYLDQRKALTKKT